MNCRHCAIPAYWYVSGQAGTGGSVIFPLCNWCRATYIHRADSTGREVTIYELPVKGRTRPRRT